MSRFRHLEFLLPDGREGEGEEWVGGRKGGEVEICLQKGGAFFEAANFEGALRWYSKALGMEGSGVEGWVGLVRVLIELGDYKEANGWADKGLGLFPAERELMAVKAVVCGRLGDRVGAMGFSDESMRGGEVSSYLWLARGDVLLGVGESRPGFCFEQVRRLGLGDWRVEWLIGRIWFHYGFLSSALKGVKRGLEEFPDRAPLWLLLGECQMGLGLVEGARRAFEQVLQLEEGAEIAGGCGEWAGRRLLNLESLGLGERWLSRVSGLFSKKARAGE